MALHAMVGWFVHLSIHPLVHSLANSLIRSFLALREQPNYKHCRSPILQPPGRLEANWGEVYRRSGTNDGGRPLGRAYRLFFPFFCKFVLRSFARSFICLLAGLHVRWFAYSFVCTSVLRSFTPSFFVRSFPYSRVTSFVLSLLFVR